MDPHVCCVFYQLGQLVAGESPGVALPTTLPPQPAKRIRLLMGTASKQCCAATVAPRTLS
jgi:hypothetical protein